MANLTHKIQGNQELVLAKESRGAAARSAEDARGDVTEELVANAAKSSTLSTPLAMAPNFQGNQESFFAEETRMSKASPTDHAREAQNGKKQGLGSPKSCRSNIANNVPTNKKMDDRVKEGEQSNVEGLAAIIARLELKRGLGPPPPNRGAVKKAILVDMKEGVKASVKKITDTGKAFCCAQEKFDVDAVVGDLPFPTRSEATATVWPKVEI